MPNYNDELIYNKTVLMWAAKNGQTQIAELLINNGADINATNKNGNTALMKAIRDGHTETAALLTDHGAFLPEDKSHIIKSLKNLTGWSQFHTNVLNNDVEAIRLNASIEGINTPAGNTNLTPLKLAICCGQVEATQALINKGAEADIHSCLRTATFAGKTNMVQYFLELSANPFAQSANKKQTALHIACFHGKRNIAEVLSNVGAFGNKQPRIMAPTRLTELPKKP